MKRFLFLLCGLLTAIFYAFSTPIEFKQCIPASGSSISSFDFELQFDIAGALEEAADITPGIEHGIGYQGSSKLNATLYAGDPETGTKLGTALNKNFVGITEGFVDNGSTVSFSFDNISVIPNQEYTVKITNKFALCESGTTMTLPSSVLSFADAPLILKFVGASTSEATLYVENSKPAVGESVDYLRNVEFYLNAPFSVNSDAVVEIREGENLIASSDILEVSPDNDKCLIADFGTDIKLTYKHSYMVLLPANSLSLISEPDIANSVYSINLDGNASNKLQLASSKINYDDKGLPISAQMIFDMPEGTSLNRPKEGMFLSGHLDAYFYEEKDESNVKIIRASLIENGKGMKWDLSNISWEPETTYILKKIENSFVVVDAEGNRLTDWTNKEIKISFTTPSLESFKFPPMEFSAPIVSGLTYEEGMKLDYIRSISFWLKDKFYTLDNTKYYLTANPTIPEDEQKLYLYEITPDGDKFISSEKLTHVMDTHEAARVGYSLVHTPLYEGKKYKVVVPEGSFTVIPVGNPYDKSKCNLIMNSEIILTLEGTTPAKVVVESCNIPDNATVSQLYTVNWVFAGRYKLSEDNQTIKCVAITSSSYGDIPVISELTPNVSTLQGKTYVYVSFMSKTTGQPTSVKSKTSYILTLPEGMLVNVVNDEMANDEIVLKFKGGDESAAKTVNVKLNIDGLHTSTHPATEGKTYQFTLEPAENWKVESVMIGENEVRPIEGTATYMLTALKGDTELTAHLEYTGSWASQDETTGVWTVEDKNIRIYGNTDHIVVDGVSPDNTICVYNVAGMLINSTRVSDGNDRVLISVPLHQTYIVTVDGIAAKIQL